MRDSSSPARTLWDEERPLTLPSNLQAEVAFLGALLQSNSVYEHIAGRLREEHFFEAVHGRIYAAIEAQISRGAVANALTIAPQFDADASLAKAGGRQYIFRLQGSVVSPLNARDYAESIIDCWQRRRLMEIADGAKSFAAFGHDGGVAQVIQDTEDALHQVSEARIDGRPAVTIGVAAADAMRSAEAAYKAGASLAIQTGLYDLDKKIGGLYAGDLLVLAARPAMGKTALAESICRNVARRLRDQRALGKQAGAIYFQSCEMEREQLAMRDLADICGVSAERQRRGELNSDEWEKLIEAQRELDGLPYYIDDTPNVGVAYIRHRARRIQRRHGLALITVDYLQLLREAAENRVQEISEITRGLKALAKELRVPVLALSQLSRAVEQRDDKRPLLSDLRESGAIEQDADVVIFLYREAYYLERDVPSQRDNEKAEAYADRIAGWEQRKFAATNNADLIVAKARQGRTGTVKIIFNGERSRFESSAQPELEYAR